MGAPPAKRQRMEPAAAAPPAQVQLQGEADFLAAHPGELRLTATGEDGAAHTVALPSASASVKELKEALSAMAGVPANKLQLKTESLGFLRDHLSAAYYNLTSGTALAIQVKKRGRR